MCPSSFVEESPIVAQSQPDVPRFDLVAILLALAGFLVVDAIGFVLYEVKFQVDSGIVNAALWIVPIAALIVFFRIRPAARLTPHERVIRTRRNAFTLLGLLSGAALLGCIATATSLHTTGDWAMLIFIALSPVSLFFLINTRFGMG